MAKLRFLHPQRLSVSFFFFLFASAMVHTAVDSSSRLASLPIVDSHLSSPPRFAVPVHSEPFFCPSYSDKKQLSPIFIIGVILISIALLLSPSDSIRYSLTFNAIFVPDPFQFFAVISPQNAYPYQSAFFAGKLER